MRKLLAVTAVLIIVIFALAFGWRGSSNHPESSDKQEASKQQKANVIGFWWHSPGEAPQAEALTYRKGVWTRSLALSFITDTKGVRLKIGSEAKVLKGLRKYMHVPEGKAIPGHRYPEWNGKGYAPLTKTITTNNGRQRQLRLKEIYIRVYDPRFPETYNFHK